MPDNSLAGKKVAVIVEAQYIPGEIKIYQDRFASYGAMVDLVSRLWGAPSQRFYSTVEPGVVDPVEWIEVTKAIDEGLVRPNVVSPAAYDAVIAAANYTTVRLRYSEQEITTANAADVARNAPAARFFREAMENPKIIKGAPCHALWLLTPSPEVLKGRKVICNPVVLADVLNAGGVYTPCPPNTPGDQQVVVDRDLVTNTGWHASAAMVDRIRDLILNPPAAN